MCNLIKLYLYQNTFIGKTVYIQILIFSGGIDMKKVLITLSALAIALTTASADASSIFYQNGSCCGAAAPMYSSSSSNLYSFSKADCCRTNYSFRNGNCCGAAAPIYSYYVPLASGCSCRQPSCCGAAAPQSNCGCSKCKPNCGCGSKGYNSYGFNY